ncbi:MAG: hypothetical protein JWR57_473, partial [Mycetocola sp.]|nr:hypothetical protein [Mycetocola sp.]
MTDSNERADENITAAATDAHRAVDNAPDAPDALKDAAHDSVDLGAEASAPLAETASDTSDTASGVG